MSQHKNNNFNVYFVIGIYCCSLAADNLTSREHILKAASAENASLKRELDNVTKLKDDALAENR